uniref:Peptidase aspartic putative domain-containing protein n=1 Tax=Phlebotomus papatasi TaxID=29031 RepID=A0A1B0DHR8_PHLPP
MSWNSSIDTFQYKVTSISENHVTKRIMLSTLAKVFDPLGLVCPVVTVAKCLLQEAWKSTKEWDEEILGVLKSLNPTIPKNFILADPEWQTTKPIDLLIGGNCYWQIMKDETHILGPGQPLLKNTVLGWVLVGPCQTEVFSSNIVSCNLTTLEKGQFTTLRRELDQVSRNPDLLDRDDALETLMVYQENLNQIEKKFCEVQGEIIDATAPPKRQEEEQDLEIFIAEVATLSRTLNSFIGKVKAKSERKIPVGASSSNNDFNALLQLMNKQLEEQRKQRLQDQATIKQVLDSQREEISELVKGLQEGISRGQNSNNSISLGNGNGIESGGSAGSHSSHRKLDTIKIPPFSGDFTQWIGFKNLFLSIVDADVSLKPAEKMQYLTTLIVGEAKPIIDTLTICDENYDVAWNLLLREFDKKSLIISAYVKEFYSLPKVSGTSIQSIQNLQRKSNSIVNALDAMQVKSRDPFLIYSVLSKLDDESQSLWSRTANKDNPTWEQFNEFLIQRSYELRMCQSDSSKSSKGAIPKTANSKATKKPKSKASSFAVGE